MSKYVKSNKKKKQKPPYYYITITRRIAQHFYTGHPNPLLSELDYYKYDKRSLTLQHHPLADALFKPAVLTPVPLGFGYLAGALRYASVYPPVLDGTFEESFASENVNTRNNELTSDSKWDPGSFGI